ncbi:hypothetical protein PR202_gb11533 [Eleusine coracana subsp. coracana]|uniref:Uncharacterized protein n=1 Tax=Eleusine coracana subsp. coracana TaxID=191504 RepID=A0AAV5ENH6_ELECO|nr:hypothetical protein PR202_gb11533 [Eleusine coracana subsp. coracana]
MATLETRSPSESPTASTVTPSTLAFTPTTYPMATKQGHELAGQGVGPQHAHEEARGSQGTRPRGGWAGSVVAKARTARARPRNAAQRRTARLRRCEEEEEEEGPGWRRGGLGPAPRRRPRGPGTSGGPRCPGW